MTTRTVLLRSPSPLVGYRVVQTEGRDGFIVVEVIRASTNVPRFHLYNPTDSQLLALIDLITELNACELKGREESP